MFQIWLESWCIKSWYKDNKLGLFWGISYFFRVLIYFNNNFRPYIFLAPQQSKTIYIVACQQGGVSNKPTLGSGQRQDTGTGILWSVNRWTILAVTTYKNLKKKRTAHLTRFLLRQGEPGTSQYNISVCRFQPWLISNLKNRPTIFLKINFFDIFVFPDKPVISFGAYNPLRVIEGGEMFLTCSVDAFPPVESSGVNWFKNGVFKGRFFSHSGDRQVICEKNYVKYLDYHLSRFKV